MIIILTIGYEKSSDDVANYFLFNNDAFLRINFDQLKINKNFDFYYNLNDNDSSISFSEKKINYNERKVIWYRRLGKKEKTIKIVEKNFDHSNFKLFTNFINKEWESFTHLFINIISNNSIWLDRPYKINKLKVLNLAMSSDLKIPKTLITNNLKYIDKIKNYITKPLDNTTGFFYKKNFFATYTTGLNKFYTSFSPSLIQEKIEKKYEIRTFYLDGECYSMAIFSQNDKQTQVDFRQYNYSKPNRNIPYKLPLKIEEKLKKLMDGLQLKTGSIDIIKGIDGEYYFLEVNPVGQFGMTSKPCNYNLEKKIYEKLISYEENI